MAKNENDDEPPDKSFQNAEKLSGPREHHVKKTKEEWKNENKEQVGWVGSEGDGGQDVAHLEEIKRNRRQVVLCDG